MKSRLIPVALILLILAPAGGFAQSEGRRITLDEAVTMALRQSPLLRIARRKVEQSDRKSLEARADFFPRITNESNYLGLINKQRIEIPRGTFGVFSATGPIPREPITIEQGGHSLFYSTTTVGQPLTQLIKIQNAWRLARADVSITEAELARAENDVAYNVQQLYCGLLIAALQKNASEARISACEEKLEDATRAVEVGNVLEVAQIQARASLLEARHQLLSMEDQIADLTAELNDLLGLAPDTRLVLEQPPSPDNAVMSLTQYEEAAMARNPEIRIAEQQVEKARRGVKIARADYIPEVTAFGQHIYQSSVPFLAQNNMMVGLRLNWNIFDFGKRRETVAERRSLLAMAEENLERLRNRSRVDIEKSYRKMERARQMIVVAREAVMLRRESQRISSDQLAAGIVVTSNHLENQAALRKAEADLLAAEVGFRLARADLDRLAGNTPR